MPPISISVASLLSGVLLCSAAWAQDGALRVVPAKPPETPAAQPIVWPTDHGEAVRRAQQERCLVLLYFTARWCGPCNKMERLTFPEPQVQAALGKFAAVKLDIDLPSSVQLFTSYGDGAVPAFAVVEGDGRLVHRWGGSGDAAAFVAELEQGLQLHADPQLSRRQAAERALVAAVVQCDEAAIHAAGRQLAELALLPAGGLPELLHELGAACRQRRQWTELAALAARLLSADPLAADLRADAELWLDEAQFAASGVVPERLQRRIAAWIEAMAEPFPGSSLGDRLRRLVGDVDPGQSAAATAWVRRANATKDALVKVGQPAFEPLLAAMQRRPDLADDCAYVLGRMKLPGTAARVRAALESGRLPATVRRGHVLCLAVLKDPQCRPWLLEYAAAGQPIPLRSVAIDGLKQLALLTGDRRNEAVAAVVAQALQARDQRLLGEALQAAFQVEAALPLDALDELLDDRRALFGDYVIADNALWILTMQLGVELVDAQGAGAGERATPAAVAALRGWLREHQSELNWSPELRRYQRRE